MGATLSINNDLPISCYIEVWTAGRGFLVTQGTVTPMRTTRFSLGHVWYDVRFILDNELARQKRFVAPVRAAIERFDLYRW